MKETPWCDIVDNYETPHSELGRLSSWHLGPRLEKTFCLEQFNSADNYMRFLFDCLDEVMKVTWFDPAGLFYRGIKVWR